MADFETIPAFCTISFAGGSASTPDVISANVQRTRGDVVGHAACTFLAGEGFSMGEGILQIFMGEGSADKLVFTGYPVKVSTNPWEGCAGKVVVRVQAMDPMFRLLNKRYTRRWKLDPLGPFGLITGITKRLYTGHRNDDYRQNIDRGHSPIEVKTTGTNYPDWRSFVHTGQANTHGKNHPLMRAATAFPPSTTSAMGYGGGTIELHDHTTLDTSGPFAGGPARSVYGTK